MLVAPLLVLFLLLVVAAGRLSGARIDLTSAAHSAARAASLARSASTAQTDAQREAAASLAGSGQHCQQVTVTAEVGDFRPGGQVAVSVACRISLGDLAGLGLPVTMTLTARSVSPVDQWRGTT